MSAIDRVKLILATVREWTERPKQHYGQFGEDAVLQHLLGERLGRGRSGFYVDVGAFAPKTFSNTYWFYRRGWSGINVDATPGSMRAFRLMRRRDTNLEMAVTDVAGTVTLYQLGLRTVLNSVSPEVAAQWERKLGRTARRVEVAGDTLAAIMEQHEVRNIDFLSVDVEGHDLVVLESNDWNRFRPTFVLVEDHAATPQTLGHTAISRFLAGRDYALAAWVPPTLFFRDQRQ